MEDKNQQAVILNLEEKLCKDTDNLFSTGIVHQLCKISEKLEIEIRKLNTPEDHRKVTAAREAVQGADKVMQIYLSTKL